MDGDAIPHEIIRCGMQRAQPSPCTMPVQYNAMPVQFKAIWLHRGQDLAQYCDSKGARHGRTCGACGACGAWIKESQRVSFELCVEEEESLCGGGRISQRG